MSRPATSPAAIEAARAAWVGHKAGCQACQQYQVKNVHFSSATGEWATPEKTYLALHQEFGFTLDPCCTHDNAVCARHFTPEENGLARSWLGETVFMNPPYGREIYRWMEKAYQSSRNGATVVCLVPARTDTKWWHDFAVHGEVRFLKGRLKFGGCKNNAPFPSAVVVFRGK